MSTVERDPVKAFEQRVDPFGTTMPMLRAQWAWLTHPAELGRQALEAGFAAQRLALHGTLRALGLPHEDPLPPDRDDDRFRDPVWTRNPAWDGVKELYLLFARQAQQMAANAPGLSHADRQRAQFWCRKWLAAASPTNQFWSNPVAQQKAWLSGGESLMKGWSNFMDDVRAGDLRLAPTEGFEVGRNLANTPGAVVARNRLLEVIHYTPTQPKVHAVPVVIVTPWINKFYVLDLNPTRSFVRWLLDQGVDVYITSWKNPDASLRDLKFDDYLTEGIGTLVDTAREISGAKQVHAVGYCIGGIALTAYMAWAQRAYPKRQQPVKDWTLFVTLVDFHAPGDIEAFLGEDSVDAIEEKMQQRGYLDGKDMTAAFRLLRSRSLIWNYVVNGWLYGEPPPSMDVLYWNMDSTRLPATEHAWYLRELYVRNKLIQPDALTLAGQPIDLRRVTQPLYAVACEDDHIVPWREAFRVNQHVSGPKRFTLTSSGHILGIVNPPVNPPKRRFRSSDIDAGAAHDAEAWKAAQAEQPGSWWPDWLAWLAPKLGPLRDAPPLASTTLPVLAPAPGTYVLET
ncbi:MAG: alpha/beta fold hydrolase [Rubrivivax sp.]|nr:alpha/beta fold hydrolase [Rubrivivax sp.]